MIREMSKMLLVIFALAFNTLVYGNSIEDGWKGIKPLRTNRTTAEKILGSPKASRNGFYNYETTDSFVHMNYSSAPCQESQNIRGDYKVPKDTVLNYNVMLNDDIKLSNFKFKREKYTKQKDSERMDLVYYKNFDDAVMLTIFIVNKIEYVAEIHFDPSPADKKKFGCNKTEEVVDNSIEEDWKGIKLLKTDRTTVEKILGKPATSRDNYYNYESDGFYFNIKYSTASCAENNYEEGYYDVPPDTVISYRVTLQKDLKLKDLKFQRGEYERKIDPERNDLIHYINRDAAILIKTIIVDGIEHVGQIHFDPSPADKKKFECKKTEEAVNNFIEDGWKGIKPLKTNRETAEKVLGTHQKVTKFGLFNYVTADFFAQVDYSDFPCKESGYGRGDYNVPPETVLNYKLIFHKQIKLNDLKFQRQRYQRKEDSEMMGLIYYTNADDAVIISVRTKNRVEYVAEIRFDPAPADKKKFGCNKTEEVVDNSIEDGWKNIKPFRTDKATVEKILGSAKKAVKAGYINYDTDEFFIQMTYTNAPCEDNVIKPGKYNVPENTVLNYDLVFNIEALVLNDFKFKREKYRRETDSKNSEFAYYINDDDGIKLYVRVFKEVEYVGRVEFYPSEKDKKKFGCKNSEPTDVKTVVEASKRIKPFEINSKIKFSSAYTKLNLKTCKPMVEPENDEDEVQYLCAGYKDYKIYVNTHGVANFYIGREISKDIDSLNLDGLPVFLLNAGFNQTIEWRLADGEPFACIVRAEYDKRIVQPYEPGMANELIVQNLKGFAPISVTINATKNKRANEEARRAADAAYGKL